MFTASALKERTSKDLAQIAKREGITGWHSMRKDELVRALVKHARSKSSRSSTRNSRRTRQTTRGQKAVQKSHRSKHSGKSNGSNGPKSRVARRIHETHALQEELKDLTTATSNGNGKPAAAVHKDRLVLMVRDPYWLHAYWDVTRQSIERVQAAMAEQWHTCRPVLRVLEFEDGGTTNTSERVVRDIEIHGGVQNWYIDVHDPPKSYLVALGYLAANGKFYSLIRSNSVTTPKPGSSAAIDRNWEDVAENYEKIYALSGGYSSSGSAGELKELFEERLRRPMGSPIVTKYGLGAAAMGSRGRSFAFHVDAEMIVYGSTKPDAYVTLAGEPVQLRPDGSFTVRLSMPDKRQVLPVVASSSDGVEQRTTVLAIERNTKVMEPMIRDPND